MKEKILKILKDINPDIDYDSETQLVEDGLFDSLEVMSIVSDLEDVYHIEIDPDDVVAENFNSVKTILKIVEKYL